VKYFNRFVSVLGCFVLFGCNTDQLPIGTQVRIAPGDRMFEIGAVFEEGRVCFTEGGAFQDVPLLISVTDSQDAPIGDVEVGVYADFTANTSNGADVIQLYSDMNGNGSNLSI